MIIDFLIEMIRCAEIINLNLNNALKQRFPSFLNEHSLRHAIESVCAEFGEVAKLTIFPPSRVPSLQCTCLLRLESAEAEERLKSRLHVLEYGGEILFFADVDGDWNGPVS